MKKAIVGLFFLGFVAGSAHAVEKNVVGSITEVFTDAENFGGCMARLDVDLQGEGLVNCPATPYVTFDCLGSTGLFSRAAASANFSNAQLAQVTGNQVRVRIRDNVLVNGFCLASRVQVISPSN